MTKRKQEMVKSMRNILWIVILFGIAAIIIAAIERKELGAVEGVEVNVVPLEDGNYLINEEDIPVLIESRFAFPLTALPVGQLDVARLERVLEDDPFVLSAEAFVDAEGKVNINIEQRQPVLRVMDNNGLNYYLDREGQQMPPSKHYAARVLVVTGNVPPYQIDFLEKENHLLTEIFELAQLIAADDFLHALVEQVYVNKRGELVLAPKIGKQTILFGRFRDAKAKLDRLKVFYRQGLPYKGWNAYSSFDLRYEGQVVCRRR